MSVHGSRGRRHPRVAAERRAGSHQAGLLGVSVAERLRFSLDDVPDDFDTTDDESEQNERSRPAAGEEWSDEPEHEHCAGGDGVGRQSILQDGLCGPARLSGATSVTDEPDSE